jgi:hypothetical protein
MVVSRHQNGTSEVHEKMFTENGIFPLPPKFSRISFKKLGGAKPTTVELIVG